jgi:hypothetical protein
MTSIPFLPKALLFFAAAGFVIPRVNEKNSKILFSYLLKATFYGASALGVI